MTYKIILKSFDFIEEFAKLEIQNLTKKEFSQLDKETYQIETEDEKDLINTVYQLIYYSRTFDGIYLNPENKNFQSEILEKVEIDINEKPIEVYDLIGDILIERNYKINQDDNYLSHFLVNFCMYKLGIHEKKETEKISLIDPFAELGDILIESTLFNPRKALFVKEKNKLPIYKHFKINPPMPKLISDKSKYVGLVTEDSQFRKLRENINEAGQKIKISKYEMEWLDSKYHKNDFDYAITFLPEFDNEECPGESDEFLIEFLYQTEFITKEKICLISQEEIDMSPADKYQLKLVDKTILEIDEEPFIVYIFVPTATKTFKNK